MRVAIVLSSAYAVAAIVILLVYGLLAWGEYAPSTDIFAWNPCDLPANATTDYDCGRLKNETFGFLRTDNVWCLNHNVLNFVSTLIFASFVLLITDVVAIPRWLVLLIGFGGTWVLQVCFASIWETVEFFGLTRGEKSFGDESRGDSVMGDMLMAWVAAGYAIALFALAWPKAAFRVWRHYRWYHVILRLLLILVFAFTHMLSTVGVWKPPSTWWRLGEVAAMILQIGVCFGWLLLDVHVWPEEGRSLTLFHTTLMSYIACVSSAYLLLRPYSYVGVMVGMVLHVPIALGLHVAVIPN